MNDFKPKPFWVQVRGGETLMFRAHRAHRTEADLVFVHMPAGRAAGAVVAQFPLTMVDCWGQGAAPGSLGSLLWGLAPTSAA